MQENEQVNQNVKFCGAGKGTNSECHSGRAIWTHGFTFECPAGMVGDVVTHMGFLKLCSGLARY